MLEILNHGEFAAPIIVFVNQKKTADMVAKDISRAGVRVLSSAWRVETPNVQPYLVEHVHLAFWEESGTTRGGSGCPSNG